MQKQHLLEPEMFWKKKNLSWLRPFGLIATTSSDSFKGQCNIYWNFLQNCILYHCNSDSFLMQDWFSEESSSKWKVSPKRQRHFFVVSNNVQGSLSAFTSLCKRKLWVKVSTVSFGSSTSNITIIDLVLKGLICQVRILFLASFTTSVFQQNEFQ